MYHCSVATAATKSAKYCDFSGICVNLVMSLTAKLSQLKNHADSTSKI